MKVAIFGSSYVKRASYFADFAMPFEVEWFGVDGMTASQPCPNIISKMARYSPDIVVFFWGVTTFPVEQSRLLSSTAWQASSTE